jgi:nucleoside-diphosphate-sugar epimerase
MKSINKILLLGMGPISVGIVGKILSTSKSTEILVYSEHHDLLSKYIDSTQIKFLKREQIHEASNADCIINSWRYRDSKDFEDKAELLAVLSHSSTSNLVFINLSSVAIYGNTEVPAVETSVPSPINSYGINKLRIELLLQTGLFQNVFNLRISNVYGDPKLRDFMNLAISSIYYKKEMVVVDPRAIVRDFVSIEMVVDLIVFLIFSSDLNIDKFLTINVSSGSSFSLSQIIDILSKSLNASIQLKVTPRDKKVIKSSFIDNHRMKEFLSLDDYSIENKIAEYAISYRNHLRSL